jgi:hypothetical protein
MEADVYKDIVALAAKEGLESYNYDPRIGDDQLRDRLLLARQNHRLTLVIGAGVSVASGLDSWQMLVQNAARAMFANTAFDALVPVLNASQRSSIIQIRFCESSAKLKTAFRVFLVEALYQNYDPNKKNPSMDALCSLILGLDGRSPVRNIITYNFDNLLEIALRRAIAESDIDLEISSIYSLEQYRSEVRPKVIRILHPHGFLPHGEEFGALAELPIVFSETDYHRHFLDYSYWANTAQLNAFARYTCLFVGLSFDCANMRRLLDFVRLQGPTVRKHAAIVRVRDPHTRHFENYLVEKDLESFGVEPVWIKDYSQIPVFVQSI